MLLSDFHCKEYDGTTRASHFIHTFLAKNQTPVVQQTPYSPDIRRYRQEKKCAAPVVPSFSLQ